MLTSRLQINDLLHYNSEFQVLICRQCQYAIQKSAVDSHLLKHKIYRGDRQCLLAEIARLVLIDEERVAQPPEGSPPIECLPVLEGYRCTLPDCQHLTVSEKRMKRHWTDVHNSGESIPPFREIADSTYLQTFFRGTKVRYFEVCGPLDTSTGHNNDIDPHETRETNVDLSSLAGRAASPATASRIVHTCVKVPENVGWRASINLNMEMLRYFHHFAQVTASTLPGSSAYWQAKIASDGLQYEELMYGLLAISAGHMAIIASEDTTKSFHMEQQLMLSCEFSRATVREDGSLSERRYSDQTSALLKQITSLVRVAGWATAATLINDLEIGAILDVMYGCIVSMSSNLDSIKASCYQAPQDCAKELSVLRNHLQKLPLRMSQSIGRPACAEDFFAAMSALSTLLKCCELAFSLDGPLNSWQSVSLWLTETLAYFREMIARDDPAAFVVLAHWAAILVRRAENHGCWFLRGTSRRIIECIISHLMATNPDLLCLVNNLYVEQD